MIYLLIEFMGVFFMVLYRGYANILVNDKEDFKVANNLLYGLLMIIFTVSAKNVSQALFNPSFAIVQNLWGKLSVGATIGYLCAHIVASLCATSVIVSVMEYNDNLDVDNMYIGVRAIDETSYYFGVLSQEIIGNVLLYFGYLHYFVYKKDSYEMGCLFYGFIVIGLSISTYGFSGGAYNLAMILGGLLFDNSLDKKYIGMFVGNVGGAIIARLLYERILVKNTEKSEHRAIKMLFSTK